MGDTLSTVFMIIMAAIIMFFFPLMDTWERQDDLSYMAVYTATVDLVDAVRNTGALTESMYDSFLTTIAGTANSYDIVMEHREYMIVPVSGGNKYEVVYLNHYSKEIENAINSNGYYPFKKGDFFYISLKNTNKTQATLMEQATFGTQMQAFKIGVPYGGQIKGSYFTQE